MEIKISVVIPTFGREKLLLNCLRALEHQDFPFSNFQVLVVHDGPESRAFAQLRKTVQLPFHLTLISTRTKKGPAAARNLGWQKARGRLIAFTDDDCLPSKSWLSTLWEGYRGEREVAFTGSVRVPISAAPTDFEKNLSHLERAEFITANCACSRDALLRTGGFDERFKMAWREDSDLHFKLLSAGIPIRKSPALVIHPARKAPWWVSLKEQKKVIFNVLLKNKFPELYAQRIQPSPLALYYTTVFSLLGSLLGIALHQYTLAGALFLLWLLLLVHLTVQRLKGTSLSANHILQVLATSALIPFLSTFWRLYGNIKYTFNPVNA